MTDVEPFWPHLWNAIDRVDTSQHNNVLVILNSLRSCAVEAIRQREKEGHFSLFPIAWAAHSLLSASTGTAPTLAGRSSFSWMQKIGCLAVLESCCNNAPKRSESPFFRTLITDSLEVLQKSVGCEDWQKSCLYELIESFMPDLIGEEQFASLQTALQNGIVTEEMKRLLDEKLYGCTCLGGGDSYVSPLLLFPPEQNKADEIVKLIQTFQSPEEESKEESSEDQSSRQADLLQPFKSLEIPFARPLPPPLMPVCGYHDDLEDTWMGRDSADPVEKLHADLIWLTPSSLRLMLLPADDAHDAGREIRYQQVLDLMQNKAFLKPLAPNEQRMIMETLNEDGSITSNKKATKGLSNSGDSERLVKESGLNPHNLHRLVENNPMVAHECLLRILRPSGEYTEDDKNEYLSSLVSMDMSLHTMEVVNRLATYANSHAGSPNLLHPEYIHLFIGSCIASCENIQDQHAQNRLVRLVCVFVQSLLRNQIVQVEDIYVVMESFCIEFSRIREAAALFKLLRSSGG